MTFQCLIHVKTYTSERKKKRVKQTESGSDGEKERYIQKYKNIKPVKQAEEFDVLTVALLLFGQ